MVSNCRTGIWITLCLALSRVAEQIQDDRQSSKKPLVVKLQTDLEHAVEFNLEFQCISFGPPHVQEQDIYWVMTSRPLKPSFGEASHLSRLWEASPLHPST